MGQTPHQQQFASDATTAPRAGQSATYQGPPLLTKKWLCHHFGLVCPGGQPNSKSLYSKVLTPDVLSAVGLTEQDVRRRDVRTFDRTTTLLLVAALGL